MNYHLLAPAKINLGLEIIRKRDDGFHDIATVFQTVSLFDRIRMNASERDTVDIIGTDIPIHENLVTKCLETVRPLDRDNRSWRIEIDKRIPIAAGLGGASTDVAAVLAVLEAHGALGEIPVEEVALRLGSDIPFLLRGGAALATGRGEILESLPTLRNGWFVLASPALDIDRKTARLYGALTPTDFSDGTQVERVARTLRDGLLPLPEDLGNAFARPLRTFLPEVDDLVNTFTTAGAPFVALSGAGPTHYTIVPALRQAITIAQELARRSPKSLRISIARPMATGLQIRIEKPDSVRPAL